MHLSPHIYMPSTEKSTVLICTMSIINIAVPLGGFIIHAKEVCTYSGDGYVIHCMYVNEAQMSFFLGAVA